MKKVVVSGMIGNGLEWYDYALYGHFSALLSTLFFPSANAYVSLIATFGVFAAGFAMRPLGAILFGVIGDRYGRKISLAVSILMMAIPTAAIGLLPTYQQIGILAPILLTVIRLLQGLSLGGEFSGSITFIVEHSPNKRRGLAGSSAMFSMAVGILAGSGVATIFAESLPKQDFESWGWRVPFLLGIVIGLIGLYIRSHLHESPKYLKAKAQGGLSKTPLSEVFTRYRTQTLQAIGVYMAVTIPFYTLVVFMNSFLSRILGHPIKDALLMNTINMLVLIVIVPYAGWLSDRIGRKKVLVAASLAMLLLAYPIFYLVCQPGFVQPMIGQMLFAVMLGFYIGPIPAMLVEIFPTSVRYTGMALSYNLCAAIFGGTTPMIATWLIKATSSNMIVAFYVMIAAAISVATLAFYQDRFRRPLR